MGTGPTRPSAPTTPSGPSYPVGPSLNYGGSTLTSAANPFITTNPLSIYSIIQQTTYSEIVPAQANVSFTSLNNNIIRRSAFINSINYFRANTRRNIFDSSAVPWPGGLIAYITNENSFKFHISGGSVFTAGTGFGTVFSFQYSFIQLPANIPTDARLIINAFLINNGSTVRRPQVRILLYDSYETQGDGNILSESWGNQKVGGQAIRWASSIKQPAGNVAAGTESQIVFNDQITAYYTNMASARNAFIAWGVDSGGGSWGLRFTASIQYPSVL